jgi:hypothetical protein
MARLKRSSFDHTINPIIGQGFIDDLMKALEDRVDFRSKYLHGEILSKYCDSRTTSPDVRRDSAITKWLSTEVKNAKTNQRLQLADEDFGWISWERFRSDIRGLIKRILGPLDYPTLLVGSSHTNGASTRIRRSSIASIEKLSGPVQITDAAVKHWLAVFSGTQISSQVLQPVTSSVLFTVPKTSVIDRVACKEPEANMLLQRAVGNHIRRRLRRNGVDLNDQSINQELARTAVSRKLATIDLSSASDSISAQLVFELLPFEWWSLLDDLRSHRVSIPDGSGGSVDHDLEMFSSMGNGFTFELESLLFYVITRVVCWRSGIKGRISVYGDDIVAPAAVVPRLRSMFHFLGFKMNLKKTHFRGTFRESCGRHYDRGVDVSPFYIRREIATLPDLILHLNHLLEWDGRGWGFFISEELYQIWLKYIRFVPRSLWGGIDVSANFALVTGTNPRKVLKQVHRPTKFPQYEGLLHWLMVKQRTDQAVSMDPTEETNRWKLVRPLDVGERTTWLPGRIFDS